MSFSVLWVLSSCPLYPLRGLCDQIWVTKNTTDHEVHNVSLRALRYPLRPLRVVILSVAEGNRKERRVMRREAQRAFKPSKRVQQID